MCDVRVRTRACARARGRACKRAREFACAGVCAYVCVRVRVAVWLYVHTRASVREGTFAAPVHCPWVV